MGQSTIFQEINIDCQQITKNFSTKKLLEILDKFAKFVLFAEQNNGELYELNEFFIRETAPKVPQMNRLASFS